MSVNPINCLKVSIQAPGFGSSLKSTGTYAIAMNGLASPKPAMAKNTMTNTEVCPNAKPIAEPKNGAEQGVASKVAKTPVKKYPTTPSFAPAPAAALLPNAGISKTPNRDKPKTNTMAANVVSARLAW